MPAADNHYQPGSVIKHMLDSPANASWLYLTQQCAIKQPPTVVLYALSAHRYFVYGQGLYEDLKAAAFDSRSGVCGR